VRRQLGGLLLAVALLPLVTALMATERRHLALVDDVLIYLVALIGITLLGGLLPAVGSAVAASLLLNWYFTPPLHRWTVEAPQNLLALVLFVSVAVLVSGTVDLAARRSALATRSSYEASVLLSLARTVLGGQDTAADVLTRLSDTIGGSAELVERIGPDWVTVAAGGPPIEAPATTYAVRASLRLRLAGDASTMSPRLIDGFGAQAAAALDRERLRRQAAEAGALAEGNRIRTALLAAVGHDLRTPLASVKAGVSSLRQTDITLPEQDRLALLATIEEGADRLDGLIGNLLDLSRLQTGSLDPLVRPTSLDEVVPLALKGLGAVRLDLPDTLPLVATDPGLLERVLANVLANAVRYSPQGRPPSLTARSDSSGVTVEVVDHGPGIPAEAKVRVFEAFQRLDDRSSGGVGLGLAVAKGFVEAMGGSIRAFDTDGGGLTMQVRLPLAAKE
jgi:two-component system sensor histidine kinase KdpD